MKENRQVILLRRPQGLPVASDFGLSSTEIPQPRDNEMLVRNLYCSLTPAMRRWMDAESYAQPIALNSAVRCDCVSRVIESRNPAYRPGDYLMTMGAVEEYSIVPVSPWTMKLELDDDIPLSRHVSLFGLNAMTAYFGLLEVGRPRVGEAVLVSGAAGSVGSLVGQIAKIKGCHVVGIAGGAQKCARLIEEYSFDNAVNYHDKDVDQLATAIRAACPAGVDVYFDNVGGIVLDAALASINAGARLVECGMISQYNVNSPIPGPGNLWQIIAKTATMQGFLGRQYLERFPEAMADLKNWAAAGKIHAREHIEVGLENFFAAFMRLFDGSNDGKLMLQVSKSDRPADSAIHP